jgi:hypothetical protein
MGCWHGCGSRHGWPPPQGWYGPMRESEWYDWDEDDRPPRRRLHRREVPGDSEMTAATLEVRLEELRDELRRVEGAIASLRRGNDEATPGG